VILIYVNASKLYRKMAENTIIFAAAVISIKKRRRQRNGHRGKLWCRQ
jgi:hypothetical protein